jgi:regulator of cell morphogenesis and NO signaling
MNAELTQQTVGGLVAERPSRSRVFERWGIDYCCGGKLPLTQACAQKSIDLNSVLHDLEDEAAQESDDRIRWDFAPLSELVDHIVTTHHHYLSEAMPRLSFLTEKVRDAHGLRHPELAEIARVFAGFRTEMESHAQKEEIVLFPYIKKLEQAKTLPAFQCGSINNAIEKMEQEHDEAGAALETIHRLTNGYAVPRDACNTYRAMLDALAELEADTHRHVHKENSILFPRAAAREAELAGLPRI